MKKRMRLHAVFTVKVNKLLARNHDDNNNNHTVSHTCKSTCGPHYKLTRRKVGAAHSNGAHANRRRKHLVDRSTGYTTGEHTDGCHGQLIAVL
jgi:hypothetical protein